MELYYLDDRKGRRCGFDLTLYLVKYGALSYVIIMHRQSVHKGINGVMHDTSIRSSFVKGRKYISIFLHMYVGLEDGEKLCYIYST